MPETLVAPLLLDLVLDALLGVPELIHVALQSPLHARHLSLLSADRKLGAVLAIAVPGLFLTLVHAYMMQQAEKGRIARNPRPEVASARPVPELPPRPGRFEPGRGGQQDRA